MDDAARMKYAAGSGRRGPGPPAPASSPRAPLSSPSRPWPRVASAVLFALAAVASVIARPAPAADDAWLGKLNTRLVGLGESPDSATIWVTFTDKGESGPGDLAALLAEARAALTPRARARRERAGVWPLVDERDLPVAARYLEALRALSMSPFAVSRWMNRAAVRVPGTRFREVAALPFVARLSPVARVARSPDPQDPSTRGAVPEPDAARSRPGTPLEGLAVPAYGRTGGVHAQLHLPALHDSGYVGTGVLVCILDEGFTGHDTHEALRDIPLAPGHRRDFVDGDTVVVSANPAALNHGAWVLGCLGGLSAGQYVGAAYGASFALARTEETGPESRAEMGYWGKGAEWADSLGADIISSSVGYFTFTTDPDYVYGDMDGHTTDVTRFAEIAASKGILVVNAVGNEGDKLWHYLIAPADVSGDSLIAVGAVDDLGRVGAFSSFGPSADGRVKPDLAARGVAAPLVAPEVGPQSYQALNGTSFSAPFVAGLAACLMQARPAWQAVDAIRALRETASQAHAPDFRVGYGIPNAAMALCWQPPGSGAPSLPTNVPAAQVIGPNPVVAGGPPAHVRFLAGGLLPGSSPAWVRVLDLSGRTVRDLWSGSLARGDCIDVMWDGRDNERRMAHSGYYFLSLEVGGEVTTARVAWLR
jgi:serine protease AprX